MATKKLLESVLGSQGEMVFRVTESGDIIYANRSFLEYNGFPEFVPGIDISDPRLEYFSQRFDSLKKFISIETPHLVYETNFRKGNSIFYLEFCCDALYDGNNLLFIQITARDITRQKKIETNLKTSEKRYKTLVEKTDIFALILDLSGKVVFANKYLQDLLGGRNKKIFGVNWFDNFVHPDERTGIKRLYFASVAQKNSVLLPDEYTISPHADLKFRVNWTSSFLNNEIGEISEVVFVGKNITSTELLIDNLRHNENRFKVLYDSLPAGIIVQNKKMQIIHANRYAAKLFNTTTETLISREIKNSRWFLFDENKKPISFRDHPSIRTLYTGKAFRNLITGVYVNTPENFRWLMINTEPVYNVSGDEVTEVIISFHDISKLIETESQVRFQKNALEKRIKIIESLYKINSLLRDQGLTEKELCEKIIEVLPPVLLQSTKCGLKMSLYEHSCVSRDFNNEAIIWKTDIVSGETVVGNFEVSGVELPTEVYGIEEEIVIETIANSVGEFISHIKAVKKLKESENNYRLLVETAPFGICRINDEGIVKFCNKMISDLLGMESVSEFINKNLLDYITLASVSGVHKSFSELSSTLNASYEAGLIGKSGNIIPVEMIITKDDNPESDEAEIIILIIDLRDRIRKEEQVRKHRERLSLALEATSDAIWDWNIIRDKGFYSARYFTMLGYSPDEFKPSSHGWEKLLHPEDRSRVINNLSDYVEGKRESYVEEFRLKCKDGSYKWILGRGKIVETDTAGRATRIIGTHQDITIRKLAEEKVRSSESKLRAIFNQTFQFTGLLDGEGRIISVNSAALEFIGKSEDEVHLCHFWDTPWWSHSEEEIVKLKRAIIDAANGMFSRFYTTHKNKEGELRSVDFTLKPISNNRGEIEFLLAEGHDITESLATEQALKRSEEGLLEAQRLAKIGNWSYDCSTGKMYWSDELFRIFNKSRTSHIPGFEFFLEIAAENTTGEVETESLLMNWEKHPFNLELELMDDENNIKQIHLIGKQKINNGEVTEIVGTVQDITERKSIEKELILAKESALRSDKLKSEFLAQMSHEIRTPINILLSSSGLIEEFVKDRVDDDIKMLFKGMRRAGNRIIRTIDLILNMSEIQTGTYTPAIRTIDIYKDILENLILEFRHSAKEKGLDLMVKNGVENPLIKGDEYTLNQVFANLIDNAIKYTNSGSVNIILEKERENTLKVSVMDTGIGMSAEYMNKIFQPFSQEDQGYTRKYEGNGLGLSLVKKYCELNNSTIKVNSTKGKGTIFDVIFFNN